MSNVTQQVVSELYDYLNAHPFFDTTIRVYLGIGKDDDVTENDSYWTHRTVLLRETLAALTQLNEG